MMRISFNIYNIRNVSICAVTIVGYYKFSGNKHITIILAYRN